LSLPLHVAFAPAVALALAVAVACLFGCHPVGICCCCCRCLLVVILRRRRRICFCLYPCRCSCLSPCRCLAVGRWLGYSRHARTSKGGLRILDKPPSRKGRSQKQPSALQPFHATKVQAYPPCFEDFAHFSRGGGGVPSHQANHTPNMLNSQGCASLAHHKFAPR
jgi:hypothetical protein